ncbi:hypothetical protein CDAR_587541 [Caerostris darwini]|uniref:Uncharacterized protein n=1 Tax=Caerostris darwini TaxID=1538125 RepID=A0AAV4SH96_9ARAC|nr:hypothetical protein CDAR_587541 [Caerostris darwini]
MHFSDLAPLLRADLFLYSLPGSLNLPQTVKENYVHTPEKKPNRRYNSSTFVELVHSSFLITLTVSRHFTSPLQNGTSSRHFFLALQKSERHAKVSAKGPREVSSGNEEAFPNILQPIDRCTTLIWLLC